MARDLESLALSPVALRIAMYVQCSAMSDLRFEWDAKKARANQKKHGVSFEEAKTAFSDEHGLVIDDPEHSDSEDRFVLLGMSAALRVLIVCHCYRARGDVIRVISARKADDQEQGDYFERWRR
jgi:uncharacterized DUF497 family protein